MNCIIFLNIFAAIWALAIAGSHFPATKGEVWPKPQHQVKTNTVLTFDHRRFQIKVVGVSCSLLSSVASRYSHVFARQSQLALEHYEHARSHKSGGRLAELHIDLTAPCEDYPHYGMDESYHLTIAEVSTLKSGSIWGILRGLQTVLHSFYFSDDYRRILVNATEIYDYPRYSHRGLLLDTSRHYISLHNILLTLDAMEMNKMNVFHWHIVDDDSFPYQSKRFPELSEHGAYYPTMVYSKADIVLVLKYARERGIRVIPEFDVPGHTVSWGASHPELVFTCPDQWYGTTTSGVLNPILNSTYELLGDLIKEVQDLFPDKYLHVGGDEVNTKCWEKAPTIQAYLKEHNMTITELFPIFVDRLFQLLGSRSQPIVWEAIFEDVSSLPASTPVHVWKREPIKGNERYDDHGKHTVNKVLEAGNKVILSAPWYLDYLDKTWEYYYNGTDPHAMVNDKSLAENILGGEACLWGERVDDRNIISRAWPRASATAEILWSSPPFDVPSEYHKSVNSNRMEEHTCRMIRHDIGAQPPNGPGFCVVNPNHL
ncbi:beta-hexosaminidase subunit beta-like isoform X1 [Cydia splendana]|uniref:beta-hexosaminidase subunit beta-like isoform X1 n=1 Tax=Cydia splendana TaxID=1100963 RepID=UPI00300CB031